MICIEDTFRFYIVFIGKQPHAKQDDFLSVDKQRTFACEKL